MISQHLSPVWPGPCVMVPMATDILLIGKPDFNSAASWSGTQDNYLNLGMKVTPDLPQPFNTTTCPEVGAHLMWTLPYSLRQGNQQDSDTVEFPLIPNRWLITRFAYNTAGSAPGVTAVVLTSDALTDLNDPDNQSQYPYTEDEMKPARQVGQNDALENWQAFATDQAFLQAVGPGDVSWSVGYDNIRNVLSLYDPLDSASCMYTYSVIGWYDTPDNDVLFNLPTTTDEEWKEAIESQFGWTLGTGVSSVQDAVNAWLDWQSAHGLQGTFDPANINLPPQAKAAIVAWHNWQLANGDNITVPDLAIQTICHSMVATVNWQGDGHAYGTGAPGGGLDYPAIAVGNTATEAIATYMANMVVKQMHQSKDQIPVIERALEAFQRDLLFDLEKDPAGVETLLHNARFETTYGGQEWIVVRPENNEKDPTPSAGQQSIPLDQNDTDALTALNTLQRSLNQLDAVIQTQRLELFMLYFKVNHFERSTPQNIKDQVNQSMTAITTALSANITRRDADKVQVDAGAAALQASLGTDYVLKEADLTPNAAPNDPVIMVCGSSLDTKLNAPGQYEEDQFLFVRYTGQSVTGISITYTVNNTPYTAIITDEALLGAVTVPVWNAIPKEVMDLWIETLILDTSNAMLIAALFFQQINITPSQSDLQQLTQQIQAQQTAVWNDSDALGVHPQALKDAAGVQGVLPSSVGVAFRSQQPWTPIYMDWKVKWFPDYTDINNALEFWQLDDIDYEWKGTAISQNNEVEYSGRTILNTKTAQNIQEKLATFEMDPNYASLPQYILDDLQAAAVEISTLDIMTQSMSGFSKQIITQQIAMNYAPTDANVAALLGDNGQAYQPDTQATSFFPIRSGHFEITDLWIVDSFGQILRGKDPNLGDGSPIPGIYWSESLTTPVGTQYKAENFGQLPPRLVQPAKVNTNLLQSDNDAIISNSADLTSPICGWVMPNHLDNSLMVYDAQGNNQGAVIKVQREVNGENGLVTEYTIRWDANPGTTTALGAPPQLLNEHLQSFIVNLLVTGFDANGSAAYDDLMNAIDATLWSMSNFSNQNGNLSLLIGRPLAVVRASVGLSLAGMPVYDQSWSDTGIYYNNKGVYDPVNPPFMNVPFTVRIGDSIIADNGVLGYFQSDDYTQFNAVYGAASQTTQLMEMLGQNRAAVAGTSKMQQIADSIQAGGLYQSSYVTDNHLVDLPADGNAVLLTLLVDPAGNIPVIPGSLPVTEASLPAGPVTQALNNLKTTFRAGPLLLDPDKIKMPTPAEVQGKWGWVNRKNVTTWNDEVPVTQYTPIATLGTKPLKLLEGWMTLSGAEVKDINQ